MIAVTWSQNDVRHTKWFMDVFQAQELVITLQKLGLHPQVNRGAVSNTNDCQQGRA